MKDTNKPKKKSFFANLVEKLDKKMEEKAKEKPCCDAKNKSKGNISFIRNNYISRKISC